MAEQGNGSKTDEQINDAGAAEDANTNGVGTVADEPTTYYTVKPHEEQTPDQGEPDTSISEPGAGAGIPEAETVVVPIVETPAEPSSQRAPKKAAAKKKVAKKPAAKKAVAKKTAGKKALAKKLTAKKPVAKKAAPKKVVFKKAVAKKSSAKKAVTKKAAAKKGSAKKSAAKKGAGKR